MRARSYKRANGERKKYSSDRLARRAHSVGLHELERAIGQRADVFAPQE